MTIAQLSKRLKRALVPKPTQALTGLLNDDGSYTIRDPNQPGNIFVRLGGDVAQTHSVINKRTGADRIHNLAVWVAENEEGDPEVMSIANISNQQYIDPTMISNYQIPTPTGDLFPLVLSIDNLKELRVRVQDGLTVWIEAGYYRKPDNSIAYWPGGGLDLTAPPTANMKAITVIGIDSATNTAVEYQHTEVSDAQEPTASPYFDGVDFAAAVNAATGADVWLSTVGLHNGQTAITAQTDIQRISASLPLAPETLEATLATTGATVTTVFSYVVDELVSVTIHGHYIASKTDKTAAAGGSFRASYRRATGGNCTLVGTGYIEQEEDSAGAPVISVDADIGTQSARIRWAGVALEDWDIKVRYEVVTV